MATTKLDCGKARELIASRELGLELDEAVGEALDMHLAACGGCRQAFIEEQELSELLQANMNHLAGDCAELSGRIAQALPARAPARRRPFTLFRLEAVAAMLLFGAGLYVGTFFRRDTAPPRPDVAQPPAAEDVLVDRPLLVGQTGRIGHELLAEDRLKTTGVGKLLLVDPENPDVKFELDFQTILVDVRPELEYR